MKKNNTVKRLTLLICVILFAGYADSQEAMPDRKGKKTSYFGIEMNNILCGYSVETSYDSILNGKKIRIEHSDVILKMSLLGTDMDAGMKAMYVIDPVTERAIRIEISVITGPSVVTATTDIKGDTVFFNSLTSGINKTILVEKSVIFSSQIKYPYLFTDFVRNDVKERKYKIYDPLKGEISERLYSRKSDEDIVFSDSVFHAVIIEEVDLSSGIKTTLWLNKADGYNIKAIVANRNIYWADKSVISRITLADMDDVLFAKVGKLIPDMIDLSRMKVRAQINSYGEHVTVTSLNFPGQKFEGTVSGNYIDGIFEIEPPRYYGENAPPFPPDFKKIPVLSKYLQSEMMIESDDPLIISKAISITSGSKDSWNAIMRLAKWVAENIADALPGGISAVNTLKIMEAECGGHSRLLAAFCRAVGIPSRLSIGCMYTNNYGGSFGQHAWTEVYMGDAGWIAVDATIHENSFVDAGHIRLGEKATFQPVAMEIIDYRTGPKTEAVIIPDTLRPMIGNYINIEQYRMFKIIYRNGGLAIDIPGRMILDLNAPDNQGKCYPKMTREISLSVGKLEEGTVEEMIMHQYFRLRKMPADDTGSDNIPVEFRRFMGNYQFAPAKLSLDVKYSDGALTTQEPAGRSKERISYSKEGEGWTDQSGTYEIRFESGKDDEITGLILSVKTAFIRGIPVTEIIGPVIEKSGVDEGIRKYEDIKLTGSKEYVFSVDVLHQLGHQLLAKNQTNDAIKIFRLNVEEYPESFMANDALAETYLRIGDNKLALKYFRKAVKLNPDYEYGNQMIEQLKGD